MLVTVRIPLRTRDVRALRRVAPPGEMSIQEFAERLSIAAVQQAISKGMKVEETRAKLANGDIAANEDPDGVPSVGGNTGFFRSSPSTAVVSPAHDPSGIGEAGARTEGAPRRRRR